MSDLVQYTLRGPAAVITLDRPEKRNALSRALIAAITDAFLRASDDPAARCVILTGNGPAFCAGMDLDELRETVDPDSDHPPTSETATQVRMRGGDNIWVDATRLSALYELIFTLSKPTIAAVNGAAVAGGAGLMTVCDLAVSVPDAKIGYPEVRRGLVAAMVMPHLLRHVGERTARWLLLTGDLIDGLAALRVGLVNQITSAENLLQTADAWARSLAEGGPKALATTKELLRRCSRQSMSVEELAKASAEPRLTDECRHGLTAFFDKKPAPWAKQE